MTIEPWPSYQWPSWLTSFRDFQIDVINQSLEALKTHDVVIINGPTGSGKTLIGYADAELSHTPAYYLSETKLLQTQFIKDFGEVGARKIWGRSNFVPLIAEDYYGSPLTCKDCTKVGQDCKWCPEVDDCPYTVDKKIAELSKVAVANYAYALNEWQSPFSSFRRDLTICDECDVLEDQLMGLVTVELSESLRKELRVTQPKILSSQESQQDFLESDVIPALVKKIDGMNPGDDVKQMRRRRFLSELLVKVRTVAKELELGDWVLTGYEKDRRRNVDKKGPLIWKPIKVDGFGNQLLWQHSKKFILMSASIMNPERLTKDLGLEKPYAYIEAPMPFKRENRRIIYAPVAQVTYKEMQYAKPKIIKATLEILNQYPEYRSIIHSVSYSMAKDIVFGIEDHMNTQGRKVFIYNDAQEREEVIEAFKQSPGAVLVGPSFTRGFDFKGDDAQINIVVKMPQASLADDQISQRLYNTGAEGKEWYATKTARELVQMTGRTTRTETDWSVSFILDAQLDRIRNTYPKMFPGWWEEALSIIPAKIVPTVRKGYLER